MSSVPGAAPPPGVETCPLCGAPVVPNATCCPDCNMTLDGMGTRPAAFTRRSVWLWAGALLVIYLIVLAIVVVAR